MRRRVKQDQPFASPSGQPGQSERESLLSRVAELLNRASEIDPQDQITLVIRGKQLLCDVI
jgi:hypothetical protein